MNEDERKVSLAKSSEHSQQSANRRMSDTLEPLLASDSGMGKDRRRFLIVAVFDVCLTALLWVISTVTKGSDWTVVFFREINILEPNFMKISLFDIVVIAICRMSVLMVFYAFLLFGHWFPVAVTTVTTTLFLVAKALFFFSPAQGSLPQYMLFVSSFVVAWFELWLVPFRVLRHERRHMVVPAENVASFVSVRNAQTDEEFRSAMEYSSDSDDDNVPTIAFGGKVYSKAEYIEAVDKAELKAKESLAQISSWKVLSRDAPEIRISEGKRIYYIRDEIACSPQLLFKAVWKDNKLWNTQIADFKVILHIDTVTELVYIVTAPALRGYISSRDFLDVRKLRLDMEKDVYEGIYVSVDSSITLPNTTGSPIRGFNGPNYVRITRNINHSDMAVFEWIQDSDLNLKGGVPRRLVENAMCSFLHGYMNSLKAFLSNHPSDYP